MSLSPVPTISTTRRGFLAASAVGAAALGASAVPVAAEQNNAQKIVLPASKRRILLSCKLGMITDKVDGKSLNLVERLRMAQAAGLDGVDLDQAARYTPEEARAAVQETGVFVHNAINHDHWSQRLTSTKPEERAKGLENLLHCIRVSHACGGSGVLLVVGHGNDGAAEEIDERCRVEIKKALPLAAALGQKILFENVWNHMHYKHDSPPEQSAELFIKFVDSFKSPWVGMYYDIGNHWKYGQPLEWIRAFGHRCVKLDIKGFSRANDKFVEIPDGDLPWNEVRKGLEEIGFTGWATAEVGGGDLKRLTVVREQMQRALGV